MGLSHPPGWDNISPDVKIGDISVARVRIIFLAVKIPALSEVQRYVFHSIETPVNERQHFFFDKMWQ